jgi:hypothetical protein
MVPSLDTPAHSINRRRRTLPPRTSARQPRSPYRGLFLRVYDAALAVYINHKINNVPAVDSMKIPAIVPSEMQLHELEPLDWQASSLGGWG